MLNENEEINVELEGVDPCQEEGREMHIGSRRSSAWCKVMEELYRGSVQDNKDGCMITVLAKEDACGYPLWIAKVKKVNKEN